MSISMSSYSPSFLYSLIFSRSPFVFISFLFPVGVDLIATLGMEGVCILQACQIHSHFILLITWEKVIMVLVPVYNFSLEMVFGCSARRFAVIFRKHRVCMVSVLFEIPFGFFLDSASDRRTSSILVLKILILIFVLILADFQMFRSAVFALLGLEI